MRFTTIAGVSILVAIAVAIAAETSFKPSRGFVPDAETAIAIAIAVWAPIYGREHIEAEQPFHAELSGNTWEVVGSLSKGKKGGVAQARIAKDDGRILFVSHGK